MNVNWNEVWYMVKSSVKPMGLTMAFILTYLSPY